MCFLTSCDYHEGSVEVYLVRSPLVSEDPLDPSLVSHLRISISGSGIDPAVEVFEFNKGESSTLFDIPSGKDVVITVEALASEDGYAVSRGRSLPLMITGDIDPVEIFIARVGRFSMTPGYGLSRARFLHASAVAYDGRLFIIGGAAGGTPDAASSLLRSVEVFSPTDGRTEYTDCSGSEPFCLQKPRAGAAAVNVEKGFLLLGGEIDTGLTDDIDFLNEATGELEERDENGLKRKGPLVLSHTEYALVAGGTGADGKAVDKAELVTIEGEITVVNMPDARRELTGSVSGDTGFIFGGYGKNDALVKGFVLFDFEQKEFSLHSTKCRPRAHASSVTLADGRVLVAGGLDENGEASGDVDLFEPSLGILCHLGSMQRARWRASVAALKDGRVLITGGLVDESTPTAEAEILDPRYLTPSGGCRYTSGVLTSVSVPGMRVRRYGATALVLGNGAVAVVGGLDHNGMPVKQIEYFVPEEK